jgi:hypothetical protein
MKSIGFIDYFIDEWHAQNYPAFIAKSKFADQFKVTHAWEKLTPPGKMSLDQFCAKHSIAKAASIQQVIDSCDCLIVLSPDNAEMHEELADLPLKSGKPVYIDKPIAPDLAAAKRLFAKARAHNTPMMSCSSLRFGSELVQAGNFLGDPDNLHQLTTRGPGKYAVYAIHQYEMLVAMFGPGALRIQQLGSTEAPLLIVDYGNSRTGSINLTPGAPFQFTGAKKNPDGTLAALHAPAMNDFFDRFIEAMCDFFNTRQSLIPEAQTLQIAALIEAGEKAINLPGIWIDIPR